MAGERCLIVYHCMTGANKEKGVMNGLVMNEMLKGHKGKKTAIKEVND